MTTLIPTPATEAPAPVLGYKGSLHDQVEAAIADAHLEALFAAHAVGTFPVGVQARQQTPWIETCVCGKHFSCRSGMNPADEYGVYCSDVCMEVAGWNADMKAAIATTLAGPCR